MLDICIQGMYWGLRYILQGIKSNSFVELTAQARNIELSITAENSSLLMQEPKRNEPEHCRFEKSTLKFKGK